MQKKKTIKAYLAHTFVHRQYIKGTVTPVIRALGIVTRNPFYEDDGSSKRPEVRFADELDIQSGIPDKIDFTDKKTLDWMTMVKRKNARIVGRDLKFIDNTDITIAYMTDISAGTTCEIFYTGVIHSKPVFLMTDNPKIAQHPWIIRSCKKGKIVSNLPDLLKALEHYLK